MLIKASFNPGSKQNHDRIPCFRCQPQGLPPAQPVPNPECPSGIISLMGIWKLKPIYTNPGHNNETRGTDTPTS